MVNITSKLKKHKIPCIKYNYSLDEETQDFTCYEGTIQLSEDGKVVHLTNLKPKIKNQISLEDSS